MAGVLAHQDGQDVADGGLASHGIGQREVGLDLVAVAAAVFLLDHVSGLGQVRDDPVRAALGDPQIGGDVPQSHARVLGDAQQDAGVIGQETPALHLRQPTISGNKLLVFWFRCRLGVEHREYRTGHGQAPGSVTGGRVLVIWFPGCEEEAP